MYSAVPVEYMPTWLDEALQAELLSCRAQCEGVRFFFFALPEGALKIGTNQAASPLFSVLLYISSDF